MLLKCQLDIIKIPVGYYWNAWLDRSVMGYAWGYHNNMACTDRPVSMPNISELAREKGCKTLITKNKIA